MDTYTKKRIEEIVDENYVHASVLYHFGIKFYDYHEKTLEQVCQERGLNVLQVISSLESVNTRDEKHDLALFSYPVDIIVEYLKHTHYIFIKERLPYLAKLIEHLPEIPSKNVASDLKFVFPLFVEDLILHIYEEEDTLFSYVLSLNQALISFYKPTQLYVDMERYCIQNLAIGHDIDDDEMLGIREITNNYCLNTSDSNLHLRVVYAELQRFEKELCTHARIENEILFPKALMLEKEVKKMLKGKTKFN
jgi:regulator of cell morphogenesis and NO signaling